MSARMNPRSGHETGLVSEWPASRACLRATGMPRQGPGKNPDAPRWASRDDGVMTSARHFTAEQARDVGEAIGIDWDTAHFDVEEFRAGMDVELEHGDREPATDVTASDPVVTGKIALAHLNEFPDYYTRLARMEAAAEEHWRGMPAPEPPVPGLTARDVALILGAVGAAAGIGAAATTPVIESRWYRRLRKP